MNCTAIINYGVGNVLSIKRSLDYVGIKSIITNNKKKIEKCSHLILIMWIKIYIFVNFNLNNLITSNVCATISKKIKARRTNLLKNL